jgi:hypothetical protein
LGGAARVPSAALARRVPALRVHAGLSPSGPHLGCRGAVPWLAADAA